MGSVARAIGRSMLRSSVVNPVGGLEFRSHALGEVRGVLVRLSRVLQDRHHTLLGLPRFRQDVPTVFSRVRFHGRDDCTDGAPT